MISVNTVIFLFLLLIALAFTTSSATPRYYRPRYIAVPLSEELNARRAVRQVYRPRPAAPQTQEWDQSVAQDGRVERQAHGHHDHVDYGAHTGHHGAFGWYADFPVSTH